MCFRSKEHWSHWEHPWLTEVAALLYKHMQPASAPPHAAAAASNGSWQGAATVKVTNGRANGTCALNAPCRLYSQHSPVMSSACLRTLENTVLLYPYLNHIYFKKKEFVLVFVHISFWFSTNLWVPSPKEFPLLVPQIFAAEFPAKWKHSWLVTFRMSQNLMFPSNMCQFRTGSRDTADLCPNHSLKTFQLAGCRCYGFCICFSTEFFETVRISWHRTLVRR